MLLRACARFRTQAAGAAAALALVAGLAACGSDDSDEAAASSQPSGGATGSIVVFAAASLTESFTELGRRFEAAHPGTKVTFSFGPSLHRRCGCEPIR